MEKIAIKVFVSTETHEVLKQVQQKLKDETGKKTSLATILNKFVEERIGFVQKTQNFESTNDAIEVKTQYEDSNNDEKMPQTQNKDEKAQNYQAKTQTNHTFLQRMDIKTQNNVKSASKIQKKYEKKLAMLEIRESVLRKNEMELFSEREKHYENQKSLFIERDELAGLRFALAEKDTLIKFLKRQTDKNNNRGANQEIAIEFQQELLSELNELKTIAHQQNENRNELFERTQESLKHYFELLLKNTNTDESKLMKFLPLAISGLTAFMVKNSSVESKKELLNLQKQIKELAGSVDVST